MGEEKERYRLSRRGFLGAGATVAAAAALGGRQALAAEPGGGPRGPGAPGSGRDLALVNGRIHTFDEDNAVVNSVRISQGRFAAVGGGIGGPGPVTTVNLRGRTVIPGMIDNHGHIIRIGQNVGHDTRQLETAFSIEEVQQVLAAKAATVPEGEFITALRGVARRQWSDPPRHPTREELDEAAPAHPVVISEGTNAQTNTLGRDRLRELGATVSDAGSVAATQFDSEAYTVLQPFNTMETKKRNLLYAVEYGLSVGLTGCLDVHGNNGPLDTSGRMDPVTGHDHAVELWREGSLPFRFRNRYAVNPVWEDPDLLPIYVNFRWLGFGDAMMQHAGVGEWVPRGAAYQESLRIIAERANHYDQHLISTGEIQTHLNQLEQFELENPQFSVADFRWAGSHVDGLTEAQVQRCNELGFGLIPQAWRYLTGGAGAPAFRMILDLAEVPVGTGNDGARISPQNPWAMIYYMTTGINSGGVLTNPGQQITREEAVRLYAGPQQGWFCGEEDLLGGIGVGRYADLAVLSADVFDESAVPDEQLRKMTSVLTIVDGAVVHDDGTLKVGAGQE